jgi:hypothetical protein
MLSDSKINPSAALKASCKLKLYCEGQGRKERGERRQRASPEESGDNKLDVQQEWDLKERYVCQVTNLTASGTFPRQPSLHMPDGRAEVPSRGTLELQYCTGITKHLIGFRHPPDILTGICQPNPALTSEAISWRNGLKIPNAQSTALAKKVSPLQPCLSPPSFSLFLLLDSMDGIPLSNKNSTPLYRRKPDQFC